MSYFKKTIPILLLLIISFSASADEFAVNYQKRVVSLALAQEPPDLNNLKSTDQVSFFILGHVLEGLLRYDMNGNLVPGVAKSWEINDKKAIFHLRKDSLWNDGSQVTAHDFVFAWREVLDPLTASEYAFIMYPVKNAEPINQGKLNKKKLGVKALDDFTLEVQFERPTGYFLSLTAFATFFPVKESFYQKKKDRFAADVDDILYNGPFALKSWIHGASLTMKKNLKYWNKANVWLNEIRIPYITSDPTAILNLYKDEKIVLIASLNAEMINNALLNRFQLKKFSDGSLFFLEFNHRPGRITGNRNLRKAIQYAFDPNEYINKVLGVPGNKAAYSLFPSWLNGVSKKFTTEYPPPSYEMSTRKAKVYLEAAKKELGLKEIPPLVLLSGDSPTSSKSSEYIQSILKARLGLDLKLDKQIFKQRLAKMTQGQFDIVASGWGPDYNDAMTFGDLFTSWNQNNRGRFKNAEYDRWIKVAMNSSVPKVRMEAFAKVQQIVFDELPILPQFEKGVIYVEHPKVENLVRRVVGADPDFSYVKIRE